MDWIEEVVQKWKRCIHNASLFRSMLATLALFFTGSIAAYIVTRNLCYGWMKVIVQRFTDTDVIIGFEMIQEMKEAPYPVQIELLILEVLYQYGFVLYLLIAAYAGLRYYFKNKILTGINAIKESVGYLSLGDYSHEKIYYSEDEIGNICSDIELLRKQLVEEKHREWDAQKEQCSINAAFAHDLRTPLTVMKGYTEFLLKYVPMGKASDEMLMEKLDIIYQHQERLLAFANTMTEIQNMEMRPLHCGWMKLNDFVENIKNTAKELEKQRDITIEVLVDTMDAKPISKIEVSADLPLIMEVCDNQISNALRYARQNVNIRIAWKNENIIIFVKDDGTGFSPEALGRATNIYFSEEKGKSHHFGIGLFVCEKLCERHGGKLTIINGVEGGAITAAEFRVLSRVE